MVSHGNPQSNETESRLPAVVHQAGQHRLEDLPRELGVLLIAVGVLGLALPGVAGAPAFVAGGLVLWPRAFGRVEDWIERRFPMAHRESMKQVGRFLDDLHRRYP